MQISTKNGTLTCPSSGRKPWSSTVRRELGGKTYICPQRSVVISRGRTERALHEWGMVFSLYSYFETMISDVTFGGYHKFGAESRILPGFEETE